MFSRCGLSCTERRFVAARLLDSDTDLFTITAIRDRPVSCQRSGVMNVGMLGSGTVERTIGAKPADLGTPMFDVRIAR